MSRATPTPKEFGRPDHPGFEYWTDVGAMWIAVFKVGYYQDPPSEVREAEKRIDAVLEQLSAETSLVRAWHGNLVYYRARSLLVNPEITDEMRQSFIDATLKAAPGWKVNHSWDNASNGVHGFSVRIFKDRANANA